MKAKYVVGYSIPDCVEGANTVQDLERYLNKMPYPDYHLVSVQFIGGNFIMVWELKVEIEPETDIKMKKLRRAKPKDIVIGKELILIGDNDIPHVMVVREVLNPKDEFKAYCAQDGCRYGLGSSWVIEHG